MSPRIVFLIRDLAYGGAQRQLLTLAKGLVREGTDVVVLHFYHGAMEAELEGSGVRAICMEKGGRWDLCRFIWRLWRTLRNLRPAVLHSYLSEPNLLSASLKPLLPGVRVVWGLRDSQPDAALYGFAARVSSRLGCALSRMPDLIIANSRSGRDYYASMGFPKGKLHVVPNGIDVRRFRPDRASGLPLRQAWGVSREEVLFGLVGRMNPMKDHATFLRAAAAVARASPNARFLCIGDGPDDYVAEVKALAASLGVDSTVIWAAGRKDMAAVYNALDALVSASSFAEGFSNVIGEAMACAVPCIGTNVGDSAFLMETTGFVVQPKNAASLAEAMQKFLRLSPAGRKEMGDRARARIEDNFTVDLLVQRTRDLCFGNPQPATQSVAQPA